MSRAAPIVEPRAAPAAAGGGEPWPVRRVPGADGLPAEELERLIRQEWLVTNGLGGYASGTLAGVATRRYHGLLVAALPAPFGRTMMLNHLTELLRLADGRQVLFAGSEQVGGAPRVHGLEHLEHFRLEAGLPVWRFRVGDALLERRVAMVHLQNTVHVTYRLLAGGPVRLKLMPSVHFRSHDDPVGPLPDGGYRLLAEDDRFELGGGGPLPPLRLRLHGADAAFTYERHRFEELLYRTEERRGYPAEGELWSPGYFRATLDAERPATLVASSEPWHAVDAVPPAAARRAERERRERLLAAVPAAAGGDAVAAELVLAADAFLVEPLARRQSAAMARARGHEPRTVVAGYHWFTDWGRDTMIGLEGLTLATGRADEARRILLTFAEHVRDGLIPNFFSEREGEGLYHTADASLWFFHAVDRYLEATGDAATLERLLPRLEEIVAAHRRGTRFGIGVAADGLLRQGEEGYQLTWMDAKVGDWVVTPRRGKAVEINGLWHNALHLLADWRDAAGGGGEELRREAARQAEAFHERFWYAEGAHLYDVVDGEEGNDPSLRPNQLLAFSLRHPVLARERWEPVLAAVERALLTPAGLRSLAPDDPAYRSVYFGDLRARDAAYHQGTVWSWLIGPFVDARLKVRPDDVAGARRCLEGLVEHLGDACIGSVSEVFDGERPHEPRGCVAQAWGVAELLRCWLRTG
jgi:predicted glycogen debranching enzyme